MLSPAYQPRLAHKLIEALAILIEIKIKVHFTEKRAPNYDQSENKIRQHTQYSEWSLMGSSKGHYWAIGENLTGSIC